MMMRLTDRLSDAVANLRGDEVRENREHWDSLGSQYTTNWSTAGQQELSERETSFVVGHVPKGSSITVLDIGIGNGRIIEALTALPDVTAIYGVDIAPAMVKVCEEKFADDPKVKELTLCDISREQLPVIPDVGFVSAIRMLKYNENWRDLITKTIAARLAPNGVLVFSMANRRSLKFLSRRYAVPYYKTTEAELRRDLEQGGWEVLEVTGFTKVPDVFYRHLRSPSSSAALLGGERRLERVLGGARGSRELFVAARRRAIG